MKHKVGHSNPLNRELHFKNWMGFKIVDPKVYLYCVNLFIEACGTNLQTAARFENYR